MMPSPLLLVGAALFLFISRNIYCLRQNIAAAKASGIPYILSPWSSWNATWQLTSALLTPLLKLLPKSWCESWLVPITHDWSFVYGHQHYARYGDSFLLVSPGAIHLFTAEAATIHQITSKKDTFPKYLESYRILAQWGDNVLTTEGATWRLHRKATSASFNEKNAALVFTESIRQVQGMISSWADATHDKTKNLDTLEHDTMRLALHIISFVGFGLRLSWPNEKKVPKRIDDNLAKFSANKPPPGYTTSFVDAVSLLMDYILVLLLVPSFILKRLPVSWAKKALVGRRDYEHYIEDLLEQKIQEARSGDSDKEGMDLMGQLVRSSREVLEDKSGNTANASKTTSLTRDEIRGNAFIMFVAGHETTANAIHFSLLELAAKPASQRRLQQELADMLGDTDPSTWDFESSVKPMMGGMMGACMNETLRLFPPVLHIPKVVTSKGSQPLKVNGKACVLPPGTRISLDAGAVHRNPRYWKVKDSLVHPGRDDTEDYIPERWIVTEEDRENRGSSNSDCSGSDEDDYDGNRDLTFGSKLFRPERGAYFPFSDGPRACLGRRIAQVEVLAALAAVFSKYSLELAVDAWASDEEVDKMSREEKVELYRKAQLECFAKLRTSSTLITLKMRGDSVPVRLVERGQERFLNLIDAEQDA